MGTFDKERNYNHWNKIDKLYKEGENTNQEMQKIGLFENYEKTKGREEHELVKYLKFD